MTEGAQSRLQRLMRALSRPRRLRGTSAYFDGLEALRGVAILLVFVYHYDACIIGHMPGVWVTPWRAFVSAGHTGVTLFFLLSAFLLSRPFLAGARGERSVSRRHYYARRALRILPLYYGALLVATLLVVRTPAQLVDVIPPALFLNTLALDQPLMPYSAVWWSLATEVQFYLLLPALPLFLHSRRGRRAGVIALTVVALLYLALASGHLHFGRGQPFAVFGLLGRAPIFAFGIALAWLYERRERIVRVPYPDVVIGVTLLLLGMLLQRVSYVGWGAADFNHLWWHIPEGAGWSMVLWLVLTAPLRVSPLLRAAWLRTLGVLSYSIYMVHFPLMDLLLKALRRRSADLYLEWSGRTVAVLVAVSLLTLMLSVVTYLAIERPFLVRKERLDG